MSAKRAHATTRLTTPAAKREFLQKSEKCTKLMLKLLAESKEPPESKEELANFLIYILGVLDIENERLNFEDIKRKRTARVRRLLQ